MVGSAFILAALVAIVPLTGLIMAITPYLMPRSECFAVTIPEVAQTDPRIRAFRKSYVMRVVLVTAACTLALAIVLIMASGAGDIDDFGIVIAGALALATTVPFICGFALMLHYRKKVQAIKKAEGWTAQTQQAVAVIAEEDIPRAASLAWNLLYIPIILLVVGLGLVWYPQMPDLIPMQAGFDGEINRYVEKSIAVVFGFPVGVVVFMAVVMAFCHWAIIRSKRPTGLGSPVTSAYAYGMFVRTQSIFMLITGLVLSFVIGVGFMASAAGFIGLGQMGALIVFVSLFVVAGAILLSVIYGQAGSRLYARMQAAGTADIPLIMERDDDEHWKLGVFYFNKDDASLFLPERFGVGWTINLARPAAWAIIVGGVLLTIAFIAVCFIFAG